MSLYKILKEILSEGDLYIFARDIMTTYLYVIIVTNKIIRDIYNNTSKPNYERLIKDLDFRNKTLILELEAGVKSYNEMESINDISHFGEKSIQDVDDKELILPRKPQMNKKFLIEQKEKKTGSDQYDEDFEEVVESNR